MSFCRSALSYCVRKYPAAFPFIKTQGKQPAIGRVCSRWLTIWQNGLAPPDFTHTGSIQTSSFLVAAAGSSQKRCCVTINCVLGSGFSGALRECLLLRTGVLVAAGG